MLTLLLTDSDQRLLLDALQRYILDMGELVDLHPTESDKWREYRDNLRDAADLRRRIEFMR